MSRFVVFDVRQIDQASVEMAYVFKDGEENYPGTGAAAGHLSPHGCE
jgi:hypothetical protein